MATAQGSPSESPSVNFHVVTHYRVPRTVLHAEIQAIATGRNPAKLANVVNQNVSWAKSQLQSVPGITWRSAGYSTERSGPKDGRWQVSEGLDLHSANPSALLPLLGTLQSRLHLLGMNYEVGSAAGHRAQRVAELRGLRIYRKEAQQNCSALGYKGIRLGQVYINTNIVPMPRPPVMMAVRTVPSPVEGQGGAERGRVVVGGNAYCER